MFRTLRRLVTDIGIEGWTLGLTGFIAVAIALLDFTPVVNLENDVMLKLLIVAVGLLMGAVATQNGKRAAEIRDLREILGVLDTEILETRNEISQHLTKNMICAKRFVLDTNLTEYIPRHEDESTFKQYRQIINDRVKKGEISFRRVESIFNADKLEKVLLRLLEHEGQDYYLCHYPSPPKPIPVIQIIAIDNEHFYIGGFHSDNSPDDERIIYTRNPEVAFLLRDYWRTLWQKAIPLNEGKRIDWNELKHIASHVGMDDDEFDKLVIKVKNNLTKSNQRQISTAKHQPPN